MFEEQLLKRLDPTEFGLAFQPVKERMLAAASGATDFAGLFLGFSMFLIASAVLLVGLLFRLGVERRAREVGLLRSVGFTPWQVRCLFAGEGGAVAVIGTAAGSVAGLGYAWLMLAGLRSWWFDAVRTSALHLHVTWFSLMLGAVAGLLLGLIVIWWSLARLNRISPRTLLAGATHETLGRVVGGNRWARWFGILALVAAAISLALGPMANVVALAFFASGAALLLAGLAFLIVSLTREPTTPLSGGGLSALGRMGVRNGARHPARSVLTAGLIASATFVIVTVAANRHDSEHSTPNRDSGDGGFALVAECDSPLFQDLNTEEGRAALGLQPVERNLWKGVHVVALRVRPGEDASCLNLYKPQQPRILGAPASMIRREGFRFSRSLATSSEDRNNPWRLLDADLPDDAVPAIGDSNTLQWILHLGLGDSLRLRSEQGEPVDLKVVAALDRSLFQGELIISEANFIRLFPSQAGYSYFLVEAPVEGVEAVRAALEGGLREYGFDATTTASRLAEFRAVENTYLATFQTLGGLGLMLGSLGLAVVLLRGVLERRAELALLRAVGFGHGALTWLVLAENVFLLVMGLALGAGSALVALAPLLWLGGAAVHWMSLTGTLLIVLAAGLLAALASLMATLRTPLLPALRGE